MATRDWVRARARGVAARRRKNQIDAPTRDRRSPPMSAKSYAVVVTIGSSRRQPPQGNKLLEKRTSARTLRPA